MTGGSTLTAQRLKVCMGSMMTMLLKRQATLLQVLLTVVVLRLSMEQGEIWTVFFFTIVGYETDRVLINMWWCVSVVINAAQYQLSVALRTSTEPRSVRMMASAIFLSTGYGEGSL